jgi:large subunit ribosomal protein L30
VTDKAQRKILIRWVRSGIGFTRRQRGMVRSLGLRRLNQVVERIDSPQVRGLVARIPHLVEIVDAAPRPPAWASIPEYTLLPIEVAPPEPAPKRTVASAAQEEEVAASQPVDEAAPVAADTATAKAPAPAKAAKPARHAKATKAAKSSAEKGKAPKAAKEGGKKKTKPATGKGAKSPKASKK